MSSLLAAAVVANPTSTVILTDAEFKSWARIQLVAIDADDEPRPTAGPDFQPSKELDAELLGYDLAFEDEDATPSAGWEGARLDAFHRGYAAGRAAFEMEYGAWLDQLEADRMDDAFCGPEDRWIPAELAEAGSRSGHPAFAG